MPLRLATCFRTEDVFMLQTRTRLPPGTSSENHLPRRQNRGETRTSVVMRTVTCASNHAARHAACGTRMWTYAYIARCVDNACARTHRHVVRVDIRAAAQDAVCPRPRAEIAAQSLADAAASAVACLTWFEYNEQVKRPRKRPAWRAGGPRRRDADAVRSAPGRWRGPAA